LAVGLLVVAAAGFVVQRIAPKPGSLGDVFARLQPGMNLEEAWALCNTLHQSDRDCVYYQGFTKDGRAFSACVEWVGLPPLGEIERGELEVASEQNGTIYIVLGRDGIVTGKRFEPDETFWKYCLRRARDVFSF
jgi:hypothetical protein